MNLPKLPPWIQMLGPLLTRVRLTVSPGLLVIAFLTAIKSESDPRYRFFLFPLVYALWMSSEPNLVYNQEDDDETRELIRSAARPTVSRFGKRTRSLIVWGSTAAFFYSAYRSAFG